MTWTGRGMNIGPVTEPRRIYSVEAPKASTVRSISIYSIRRNKLGKIKKKQKSLRRGFSCEEHRTGGKGVSREDRGGIGMGENAPFNPRGSGRTARARGLSTTCFGRFCTKLSNIRGSWVNVPETTQGRLPCNNGGIAVQSCVLVT